MATFTKICNMLNEEASIINCEDESCNNNINKKCKLKRASLTKNHICNFYLKIGNNV